MSNLNSDNLFGVVSVVDDDTNMQPPPAIFHPNPAEAPEQRVYIYEELEFRGRFVNEYIKDDDPIAALMRCGFSLSMAKSTAPRLLAERYVQMQITNAKRLIVAIDDDSAVLRDEIMVMLRKVMADNTAKGSDRVAAAKELSAMFGLHAAPVAGDSSGVMVLPPSPEDLDTWSKIAEAQQQQLKRDVLKGYE